MDPVVLGVAALVGLTACVVATWGGPFGATVGGADLYAMFLPKHAYVAQTYRDFALPLWNPYEFAGLPLHGTAQGSALYAPLVLPNLFLDRVSALQVAYWSHIVAFCVLTTGYLRDRGLGRGAAWVASFFGVVWFFESANAAAANQSHYLFEYAYVPAILWAWHRFAGGSRSAGVLLPLLVCFQWLPGYPEFPMDTAVLLGLVVLVGPGPPLVRRVAWVVALVALGALIAGVQLVPLAEATSESLRVRWASDGFGAILAGFAIGPSTLHARLLDPMGAAGAILLLIGLATPAVARRGWAVAFGFAFFAVTWPLALMYEIYPYKLFRFAWGWVHLAPFFAACLAGLAVDALTRQRRSGALAVGAAAAIAALAAAEGDWLGLSVALACVGGLALGARVDRVAWIVVALAVGQSAVGFSDLTVRRSQLAPDLEAQVARSARLHRLRAELPGEPRVFGEKELRSGSLLADRLPAPIGHEPAVPPRRVARLVRHIGMWNAFGDPADKMALWRGIAKNPAIASVLGLGLVTGTPQQMAPLLRAGYRRVGRFDDDGIVVFRPPVPRVALYHDVVLAPNEEASFKLVTQPGFDPFRRAVVEGTASVVAPAMRGRAPEVAEITLDEPERVVVRARLVSPGLLVLRDAQYPGWTVTVGGVEVPNLTANFAFRGVALDPGTHEVVWRYRPLSVGVGLLLSGLGLSLLSGLAWWLWRAGGAPWPAFEDARPGGVG